MIVELKKEEAEQERSENNVQEKDISKNIVTDSLEKIGLLEKKVEQERNEKKSLNERIEDLVIHIEKVNKMVKKEFSFKRIFIRGLLQGLGIVIGSTILAGVLYSISTKFIDKNFIKENTLKYILEQEK